MRSLKRIGEEIIDVLFPALVQAGRDVLPTSAIRRLPGAGAAFREQLDQILYRDRLAGRTRGALTR